VFQNYRAVFFAALGVLTVAIGVVAIWDVLLLKPDDGARWLLGSSPVRIEEVVPGGPADRVGLRPGDRILGIGSSIIRGAADGTRELLKYEPGDAVPYLIQRGRETLPKTLVLGLHRTADTLYGYSVLLALTFLATGGFVISRKPDDSAAVLFYYLCLAFTLFLVCSQGQTSYYSVDLIIQNAGSLGFFLLPALFVHLFLVFPSRPAPRRRWPRALLYAPSLLLFIRYVAGHFFILSKPFRVVDVDFAGWVLWGIYSLAGVLLLAGAYRRARDPLQRRQIQMILWGSATGLIPFLLFGLVSVRLLAREDMLLAGFLPMVFIPISFAYAIIRYRLLDIEVFVRRSVVYAILTGLLAGLYLLLASVLGNLAETYLGIHRALFSSLAVLVLAFIFNPLRSRIQALTDRTLFRASASRGQALSKLGEELSAFSDVESQLDHLLRRIDEWLNPQGMALYLSDSEGQMYRAVRRLRLPRDVELPVKFRAGRWAAAMTIAPVPSSWTDESLRAGLIPDELADLGGSWPQALFVPLTARRRVLGLLVLGDKASGDLYSSDERGQIMAATTHVSLALDNARLVRDVSRAKERLVRTEKLATLGTLAAGIAHEVRNPLTAIKMQLQGVSSRDPIDPLIRHKLEVTLAEVDRLEKLIWGMLDYAGPVDMNIEHFDLPTLIDEVIGSAQKQNGRDGISAAITYEDVLPEIEGDRRRLSETLVAVISNAFHFARNGGEVHITVRLRLDSEHEWVEIEIADDGPGIQQSDLPHVFQPFFTRRKDGAGLGLASALKFVEEHGGTITARNREQGGAAFTITLPVKTDSRPWASM